MTWTDDTTTRRPVNTSYLVVGLVFLGIAGAWLLRETGVMDPDEFQWLLPLILVVAGGAGLVASVAKGMSRSRRGAPGPAEEQPWAEDDRTGPAYGGEG